MEKMSNLSELSRFVETTYDDRIFKRGEIYYVNLEDISSITTHITHKSRPALIIQNDKGNIMSSNLIVALLSTSIKKMYPFQYQIKINGKDSVIMFEQILTIDKNRVLEKYYELTPQQMKEAELKLIHSLQLEQISMAHIIDINVLSMITRKTAKEEIVMFEIQFKYKNNSENTVQIKLDTLQQFNSKITKDTELLEITRLIDNCKGINWIINSIM